MNIKEKKLLVSDSNVGLSLSEPFNYNFPVQGPSVFWYLSGSLGFIRKNANPMSRVECGSS
ncbi:MAG: hypothetical protein ACPK85_17110 [Methanosarcina sp.]